MNNNAAEKIMEHVNLKKALEFYGLTFNARGFACCPFHKEKTPSFSVKGSRYKCFGCNETGSVIDFTRKYFGLNFGQAIVKLNSDFGVGLSSQKPTYRQHSEHTENMKIKRAYERWKEERHSKYLALCSAHCVLFQQLQRQPENLLLAAYLLKLELLLENSIEEVRF